jgi:uncharacterized hydrophobic protein (TIGR00271 family)
MGFLSNVANDNKFTPENLPGFEAKIFFEGDRRRLNLEQFIVMLFLSTVIATYGVLGDSTATVIGAMIIAPLMKPIMGTAAGLVMGDMKRAGQSFLVVVLGVSGVIVVAWLLTLVNVQAVIDFNSNSQITGRISPRLIDLFAALAAGAAGAFAMSRDDVGDSLPGVAISISLVPPLCVVGVGLAEAEWSAAYGAMLLFVTNFLSILLAGGGVLALLGLSAAATADLNHDKRRKAFVYVTIGVILVTVPLGATSLRVYEDSQTERAAMTLAEDWIEETGYTINRVDAHGNQVTIVISGSGDRLPLADLGPLLDDTLDEEVDMELIVVPSERETYRTPSG